MPSGRRFIRNESETLCITGIVQVLSESSKEGIFRSTVVYKNGTEIFSTFTPEIIYNASLDNG